MNIEDLKCCGNCEHIDWCIYIPEVYDAWCEEWSWDMTSRDERANLINEIPQS